MATINRKSTDTESENDSKEPSIESADSSDIARLLKFSISRYRKIVESGDVEAIQKLKDTITQRRDLLSEIVSFDDESHEPLFIEAAEILKPREEKVVRKFYKVAKKASPLKWTHGA